MWELWSCGGSDDTGGSLGPSKHCTQSCELVILPSASEVSSYLYHIKHPERMSYCLYRTVHELGRRVNSSSAVAPSSKPTRTC